MYIIRTGYVDINGDGDTVEVQQQVQYSNGKTSIKYKAPPPLVDVWLIVPTDKIGEIEWED